MSQIFFMLCDGTPELARLTGMIGGLLRCSERAEDWKKRASNGPET